MNKEGNESKKSGEQTEEEEQGEEKVQPILAHSGARQRISHLIIRHVPRHTVYVEPFAGGATLLFQKPFPKNCKANSKLEVINDTDNRLINFYRCLQFPSRKTKLVNLLKHTLYSSAEHCRAEFLLNMFSNNTSSTNENNTTAAEMIAWAWAYFVSTQQSVFREANGKWAVFPKLNTAKKWNNRIDLFTQAVNRLKNVIVMSADALDCIRQWDSPETFFYCDPPYYDIGHNFRFDFASEDFQKLVDALGEIEGSFILSGYLRGDVAMPKEWRKIDLQRNYRRGLSPNERLRGRKMKYKREYIWIKVSDRPISDRLQKMYDCGKFNCFKKNVGNPRDLYY